MKQVEVVCTKTAEYFSASIDKAELRLVDGRCVVPVPAGEHALQWFVQGASGSLYTIQIVSPSEARFEHGAVLDEGMKDAGVYWFSIKGEA